MLPLARLYCELLVNVPHVCCNTLFNRHMLAASQLYTVQYIAVNVMKSSDNCLTARSHDQEMGHDM